MKAIETAYAGCRFRSRLEARWAVFMDTLRIEWQYEAEGFLLEGDTPYLPDFYLPGTDTWVEVKPSRSMVDWDVLSAMDFHFGVRGMANSLNTNRGLALLFDIPDPHRAIPAVPVLQHHKGLWWSEGRWTQNGIEVINQPPDPFDLGTMPTPYTHDVAWGPWRRAYEAARSARFSGGLATTR